jgi:predicted negative regulator of RcsB-dependent stress response
LEDYRTDEEQVEALKRWWDEKGKSTLVMIALAVVVSFGWRYWQDQQQAHKEAAASVYQELLALMSAPTLDDSQRATAGTLITQLTEQFDDTGYDHLASLAKARLAMDAGDFAAAASVLTALSGEELGVELAALVNLRLAKVQFSQQDYTAALNTLKGDMQKYAAQAAELRGDIYAAQGDAASASAAYQESQTLTADNDMLRPSPLLQIKIDAVASATTGENA